MKRIGKIEIAIENLLVDCIIEYTSPLKASFFEYLLLELANSFNDNQNVSELLINEFEIPKSMLYMFSSSLFKLELKELLENTTEDFDELVTNDLNLTTSGEKVYLTKRIPQEWKKQKFNVQINDFEETFSLEISKSSSSKYKIPMKERFDIKSYINNIYKYINNNKKKLSKYFNMNTEFNSKFTEKEFDFTPLYIDGNIDILLLEDYSFSLESKYKNTIELFAKKYNKDFSKIVKGILKSGYSKVDRTKSFNLYSQPNKYPLVFSAYNIFSINDMKIEILNKSNYMYGLNNSNYGFVYDIELIECMGIEFAIEQITYSDELYLNGIDEVIKSYKTKINTDINVLDEYISIIPTLFKDKYVVDIIKSFENNICFEKLLIIIDVIKKQKISNCNDIIKDTAFNLIISKFDNRNINLSEIEKYRNTFNLSKEKVYKYYIKNNKESKSKKEIIDELLLYVKERFLIDELNIENHINDELENYLKNKKYDLGLNLSYINKLNMIIDNISNIYNEYKFKEKSNSLTKVTKIESNDINFIKEKLKYINIEMKNISKYISNDNEKMLRNKIDIITSYKDLLYELLDVEFSFTGEISFESAKQNLKLIKDNKSKKGKKNDNLNSKIMLVSYILRRLVEEITNKDLKGKDKFISYFDSNEDAINESYDSWRTVSKLLHGEVGKNSYKLLKRAYDIFEKHFNEKGDEDESTN